MWKLIDKESMLEDLKKGQIIALQQNGSYVKFSITTFTGKGSDYVLLSHADGQTEIKMMPTIKLLNENWYVQMQPI